MNNDLMKALLALDAYNRGYNQGINLSGPTDTLGKTLGNYTVIAQSQTGENDPAVLASFYAIAYEYGSEVVISYRGTDNISGDASAFVTGAGFSLTTQAELAIKFFQAVDLATEKNIALTGHSLGGGLAGFTGALLQKDQADVVMFDNMPFENAVRNFYHNSMPSELNGTSYSGNPANLKTVYGTNSQTGLPAPWLPSILEQHTLGRLGVKQETWQCEKCGDQDIITTEK